jgi:hypothetical protein
MGGTVGNLKGRVQAPILGPHQGAFLRIQRPPSQY